MVMQPDECLRSGENGKLFLAIKICGSPGEKALSNLLHMAVVGCHRSEGSSFERVELTFAEECDVKSVEVGIEDDIPESSAGVGRRHSTRRL